MSNGTIEQSAEAAEKTMYLHGLPFPHGAFRQFKIPDEIMAVTEETEGRTIFAPPVDMDSDSSFRWRTIQIELQQLVENWEPITVSPPEIPHIKPRREDRDSLRAMVAAESSYVAELRLIDFTLATERLEAELSRLWSECQWARQTRKRASAAAMVDRANLALSWLIEDAPEELIGRMKELETAKNSVRFEISETGQLKADRLSWVRERVAELKRMPSPDYAQTYELRQLEPELKSRLEALAKIESEIAEVKRQMFEA